MIQIDKLFPDNYLEYVEQFNRVEYESAFNRYLDSCEKTLADYNNQTEDTVAKELVVRMMSHIKGLWKRRKSLDIQYFMMLYLMPMLLQQTDSSFTNLARKIRDEWLNKSGENSYDMMTFKDISSGFTNNVMGFRLDIGRKQ